MLMLLPQLLLLVLVALGLLILLLLEFRSDLGGVGGRSGVHHQAGGDYTDATLVLRTWVLPARTFLHPALDAMDFAYAAELPHAVIKMASSRQPPRQLDDLIL